MRDFFLASDTFDILYFAHSNFCANKILFDKSMLKYQSYPKANQGIRTASMALHEPCNNTPCSFNSKGRVLFENRPAIYFSNYKENNINNTRMLDTLFIML